MKNPFENIAKSYIEKRAEEEGTEIHKIPKGESEYREGKRKLNFEYNFSFGETFKATEDKEGVATIVIKQGEGIVFDFKELLPEGVEFATPTSLRKLPINAENFVSRESRGKWRFISGTKLLSVGFFEGPKSIFTLLHEIGHARFLGREKEREQKIKYTKIPVRPPGKTIEEAAADGTLEELMWDLEKRSRERRKFNDLSFLKRQQMELESIEERNAWTEALKIARNVKRKYNIDLLEGFESFEELKRHIYSCLVTFRYKNEQEFNKFYNRFWRLLFGGKPEKEELIFLEKLFDKVKYRKRQ